MHAHVFTAAGLPGTINSTGIELTDFRCTNNRSIGHVFLEWTQPNGTGGQDLTIEHYIVNVTGPVAWSICPANQCNVTTINTTITGLLCNTSYTVTVRAVNCIGEGNSSDPIIINTGLSHTLRVSSTLASSFTYYYVSSSSQVPLNVMATVVYNSTDATSTTQSIQGKN